MSNETKQPKTWEKVNKPVVPLSFKEIMQEEEKKKKDETLNSISLYLIIIDRAVYWRCSPW